MKTKAVGVMVVVALASLVVGAGLERVRKALSEDDSAAWKEGTAPEGEVRPSGTKDDPALRSANDALRAANEALRRRVAELERGAGPGGMPEPEQPVIENVGNTNRGDRVSRRASFAERMEKMRKENPEQYAEMQKRREEFRQTMEQRAQDRAEFLAAVDTRAMDDVQRENHEKLLAAVARVDELRAQMEQGTERTPEMRQEMGELMGALSELYGNERRYLFEAAARSVGYDGAQVSDFADQMQMVVDNTTFTGFGHRGHGGPPPPPSEPSASR